MPVDWRHQESGGLGRSEQRRRHQAVRRVKAGDGRPLQTFRWWQNFGRALFSLRLPHAVGHEAVYTVDVRHWGNQSGGNVRAHLYLDGRHHAESKLPARFPIAGGIIEVAMSGFGMKRCHYITSDGGEEQLTPDPNSAEGRRVRLQRKHPALSRGIGFFSVFMLLVGVVTVLLQISGTLSHLPLVADSIGTFESPLHLPIWLTIGLGLGAVLGSVERALRMQYSWLDSVGN